MIKYFCDRCGKEVKNLMSVNMSITDDSYYSDNYYSYQFRIMTNDELMVEKL